MMTQRLIRARPIEFGIHLDSAVDTIESDGQKLQQILVQLLTNALKFTEKGTHRSVDPRTPRADRGLLEIAVADTGIGIKREDQEHIFDDFRQLDGSSTRHYGGTGVGLALCQKTRGGAGRRDCRWPANSASAACLSLLLPVRALGQPQNASRLRRNGFVAVIPAESCVTFASPRQKGS